MKELGEGIAKDKILNCIKSYGSNGSIFTIDDIVSQTSFKRNTISSWISILRRKRIIELIPPKSYIVIDLSALNSPDSIKREKPQLSRPPRSSSSTLPSLSSLRGIKEEFFSVLKEHFEYVREIIEEFELVLEEMGDLHRDMLHYADLARKRKELPLRSPIEKG